LNRSNIYSSVGFAGMAVACALFAVNCKGSKPLAAVVNGDPITKDEYYAYLELKPQAQVIVNPNQLHATGPGNIGEQNYTGPVVGGSLGLQALGELIQQKLIEQKAKDEGVTPSNEQIDKEIADRKAENPNFIKQATDAGYTFPMIKANLAAQLAQYNLTTKGINVTDNEVTKYIADHPKEFEIPEQVELLWILIANDAKKNEADKELKSGRTFIQVAQKYSEAQDAAKYQWHFPQTVLAQLPAPLVPIIKKTAEQGETDWMHVAEGWAKFYVNKKSPSKPVTIDDALKAKVKKALMLQRGGQGKDLGARVKDRLKTSKIEIAIEAFKEPWKRSIEALQAAASK
jgi:parvulin-like peptidyl-prolyl isomerase